MGDHRRSLLSRPHVLGVLLFVLALATPASAQIAAGDMGGACLSGKTCHDGACGAGGLCVPCGMPGQLACPNRDADKPAECHLSGWGYVPVATAAGTICINPKAGDCGHVGEPACDRDGRNGCYYGVPAATPAGEVCLACGGMGEACCTGTDRVCDSGTCQGGICRPGPADAAKAIREAIIACRFGEARQKLAALPQGNPDKDALGRWLKDAEAIERGVADQVRRADEALAAARRHLANGELTNAYVSYHRARAGYERARDRTRCKATAEALDVAAMKALIATDQALTAALVEEFAKALTKCDFKAAEMEVKEAERLGIDQAAKMRQRYAEARSAEKQARDAFARGRAENARANGLMARKRYQAALDAYRAARTQFERARQRTVCAATRDAIAKAIHDVGANELIAIAAVDGAGSGGGPAAPPARGVDPTPPGTHPCLDPSIKPDRGMAGYQRSVGGGGSVLYLKGPYVCGSRYIGGTFETFDGATVTTYRCDRKGDRYTNCTVVNVDPITATYAVKNGIDYHYKCGKNDCWLNVFPRKGD